MPSVDVGQVVLKVAGREAGKIAAVVKKVDANFVMITGPKLLTGVKRRKANVEHIEPTKYKIEIKEDATDEEVIEAMKKAQLITKLNLKLPSAAEMKAENAKPAKEEKPKKEEKHKAEKKETKAKAKKA